MAVQMYLIHPKHNDDDAARERIAEFIARRGGFVLMATSHGSLITAFDDGHIDAVRANELVEFASGVTLNPDAPGAAALQRVFAENVAAQLAERGLTPGRPSTSGSPSAASAHAYPPGYRPMRWPARPDEKGGE